MDGSGGPCGVEYQSDMECEFMCGGDGDEAESEREKCIFGGEGGIAGGGVGGEGERGAAVGGRGGGASGA